jgi:hypothetical protein
MSDYNGQPGGGATPDYMKNQDDTFTDFSNYADERYADRIVAAPGRMPRDGAECEQGFLHKQIWVPSGLV